MSNSQKSHTNQVKDRTQMIICAIDSLKGRKARPDEQKICNFVERKFGVKKEDIVTAIEEAVILGSVLKVKYKDSVSYRNPMKFSLKMSNHIMSMSSNNSITPQNMKHVLRELRALCRSASDGVSKLEIIRSLHSNCHSVLYNETLVDKVLTRAIQTGSVRHLANGNYVLSVGKRIVPRKGDADQTTSSVKFFETQSFGSESDVDNKSETKDNDEPDLNEDSSTQSNGTIPELSVTHTRSSPEMRRERPVSKRKKFKKSLGPDFIESSELGPQYMRNSFEPKCDLCQLRAKTNKRGEKEELLSCKDCNTKAHPSCMDYSEELAERSGRSPWQCMECKTCDICHDSKDGANMLVCDLCDKGFHMNCHIPALSYKPNGKWECSQCIENREWLKVDQIVSTRNSKCDPKISQNKRNDNSSDDLISNPTERLSVKLNSESSSLSSFVLNSKENCGDSYPEVVPNPQKWSPEDVERFIRNIGFPEQSLLFKEQEIDGTSLLLLRRSDVLTGFQMKLGPALKIYSHIVRLQKND